MMNLNIERDLIQAAKNNVANKTTSLGDREHKVDVTKYVSQQRFNEEISKVFNRLPSPLLHSSALDQNDSYQSVETSLGSLIVSRDSQGKAHVFRNSCRHRGAQLVQGKQCKKRIVCPYHAWSYATDGQLSNVPAQSHCFPDLDKAESGLITLPSVEKFGFIWLCPTAVDVNAAEMVLDTHLADMQSHMRWMQASELKVFDSTSKIWNGNWKLFVEGGLETYHFAFAHKETIAPSFYNNVAVIDQISQHFRVMMPTRELESGDPQSIHDCSHTLFLVSPNSAFLVQKEHVDWIHFQPLATNQSEITVTTLIPQTADLDDPKQLGHWRKNHQITNATLDEDWALGASIQTSLDAGALPYLQYGKNEWALHAFGELLEAQLNQA